MLKACLFGKFDVSVDGKPIAIPSRAAQSLLAYLLLHPETPHRREKLAGLLWPDTSDDNARRNLRQELWRIRKVIGSAYLDADDIVITFKPKSDDWVDATVLEKTSGENPAIEDLIATVSVYEGELLPGFYDEWVVLERERLRAIFERKMQQLAERLVAEQRWSAVFEWGERWVALGQSPEPAYRALMQAHAALGEMSQVAAVFERCSEALRDDLGVEPSEQTRLLFERLKAGAQVRKGAREQVITGAVSPLLAEEPPAPCEPPFKGLHYFEEADADLLFGRERLIERLVKQLRAAPLLVVIGASGSGKSSLVRAGLVPELKRPRPSSESKQTSSNGNLESSVQVLTPTAHPLETLAVNLTRETESATATSTLMDDMARDPRSLRLFCRKNLKDGERRLLVVDQFEEVFTLCCDEDERRAFIDNLLIAADVSSPVGNAPLADNWGEGATVVVIALRADFYAHCGQYANLCEALEKYQAYVGPMNADELQSAMEGPAQRGGWEFEPGLVDLILRDVGNEPGALPLLSHALLETWRRRRGHTLTFAGYTACGGVRGALAKTAESVYQNLSPEQQTLARNVFLRLTELGEGTEDTRRRATIAELASLSADVPAIENVLGILADARLVMVGETTAEVAHEALIREWSRLREWLNENREELRLHRHLTEAAQEWERLGRDPGSLYRGTRLGQALEWAASKPIEMNLHEWSFLGASRKQAQQEEAEREAQRQRELVAAHRLAEAERRRANILRWAVIGSMILLIVMIGLALFAFSQRIEAVTQRDAAQKAQSDVAAQRDIAENERRIAFARELAASANNNLDIDPERSVLLALQAVSVSTAGGKPVVHEAEEALHRAVMASRVQLTLSGHTDALSGIAFSPDGKRIVTGSYDRTAKVWDAATGRELLTLSGHTAEVKDVDFGPEGTRIATASYDKTAKVWDAATGKELLTLSGHTDQVWTIAFSPDGRRIATAGADHTAKVWDASSGKELLTLSGHTDLIRGIVYSPDGKRIYTGSYDNTAKAWDAATGKELLTFTGHTNPIWSIAISPDGTRLLTSGFEGVAKIWDTTTGRLVSNLITLTNAVAFNQIGTQVATCGQGTATVWDVASGRAVLVLSGHAAALTGCVFSPDPSRALLATASSDFTAKVWDISLAGQRDLLTIVTGNAGFVQDLVSSPDGKYLASASADKTATIWDAATGAKVLTLVGHTNSVNAAAFSPDSKRLATASDDRTAKIWDLSTGKILLTLPNGPPMQGLRDHTVAFSPDGKRVVLTSDGNSAKVWDATSGQELLNLSGHKGLIQAVAYSSDGHRILTASQDRTSKVWDAMTGKELLTLSGTGQLWDAAFSPDAARIVTAGSGNAMVWDAVSGKLLLTLSGHTAVVVSAAFSPDGARVATGAGDRLVKVWNISSAGQSEQPLTLYGCTSALFGIVFSPDGRRLAVACKEGAIHIYAVPIDDIVAIAKSRLTRTWTLDECQKFLHTDQCPADPRLASDVATPLNR